jgi:hypothetical protein
MQTKFEIIETDTYILAVSDEEIKSYYTYYYDFMTEKVVKYMADSSCKYKEYEKKIIAYRPKNNAPELDLPLLPEIAVEDDVENWLDRVKTDFDKKENYQHGFHDAINIVKAKIKAATKKYSEEDLRKAMLNIVEWCVLKKANDFVDINDKISKIIQSLRQPKWFVIEYKTEYTEDGLDYQSDELKTTTNAEGKQVLVGTYLYE